MELNDSALPLTRAQLDIWLGQEVEGAFDRDPVRKVRELALPPP